MTQQQILSPFEQNTRDIANLLRCIEVRCENGQAGTVRPLVVEYKRLGGCVRRLPEVAL